MADRMNRAHALEVAAETHGKTQKFDGMAGGDKADLVVLSVPNDPALVVAAAERYVQFLDVDEIVEAEIVDDDRDAVTVMVMQRKHEPLHPAKLNDLWVSTDAELALHLPELSDARRRMIAANVALRFQRDTEQF